MTQKMLVQTLKRMKKDECKALLDAALDVRKGSKVPGLDHMAQDIVTFVQSHHPQWL